MKSPPDERLEQFRHRAFPSDHSLDGTNVGVFLVPVPRDGPIYRPDPENEGRFEITDDVGKVYLTVVASEGFEGFRWESVDVTAPDGIPTWNDMQFVKDLFWDEEEVVVQYHPKVPGDTDHRPLTLHLWKPTRETLPVPPQWDSCERRTDE